MSKQAHLPDGTVLEFPDETPDTVMDTAVKSHLSGVPQMAVSNPMRAEAPDPRTIQQQAGDAANAFGHHVANIPVGITQGISHLAGNPYIAPLSGGLSPLGMLPSQLAAGAAPALDQSVQKREAAYQSSVPNSSGAIIGAGAGELLPWMYGLGEARAAGILPKISEMANNPKLLQRLGNLSQRARVGVTEGGAMAAPQPVTGQGDYGTQKGVQMGVGAAAGGVLPVVGEGLSSINAARRYLFAPGSLADEAVSKILGKDPATVQQLQQSGNGLPGVIPTAAEAVPSAANIQAERGMRNAPGTAVTFANQDVANNAARMDVVRKLGGTDPELQAAHTARDTATAPYRNANLPEQGSPLVDPAPVVTQLQQLAKSADDTVRAQAEKHLAVLKVNDAGGKVPAYTLDDIRQQAGKMIDANFTPQQQVKYGPVKTAIQNTLDAAVPGYSDYLAAYAKHSEPINTMESVRKLIGKVDNAGRNLGGDQAATLADIRSAITGDDKARYPMSDNARAQLQSVLESLQGRNATNNPVAALGSSATAAQTAQLPAKNIHGIASGVGGLLGAAIPYALGGGPGVELMGTSAGATIGNLISRGLGAVNDRNSSMIAQRMANSQEAAQALQRVIARNPTLSGLARYLPQGGAYYNQQRLPPPRP